MIIATDYQIEIVAGSDWFRIKNRKPPLCPDCGSLCSGYDTRPRQLIDGLGVTHTFKLRRLRCPSCGTLHLELPDLMQPRKHYDAATIARAQAGDVDSCPAEDSTIRRWRK